MKFLSTTLSAHKRWVHAFVVLTVMSLALVGLARQRIEPRSLMLNDAYVFKVDGEALFTFQNVAEVNAILDAYKLSFMRDVDPDARILSMEFLQRIDLEAIKIETNHFDQLDLLEAYLAQTVSAEKVVVVERGDSVWKLAEHHGVSIESIMVLNPNLNPDRIHPGDQIRLEASDPMIDVRIVFENTVEEIIPYPVETIRDASMYRDERKVVTQGSDGAQRVSYRISLLNGVAETTEVLEREVLQEPTQHVVRVGTRSVVMRATGGVFKVTTGTFQSGFGYRTHPVTGRRTFHAGIDISNTLGTPIYAYSAGTVTGAGWEGALGNTITINHGNGLVTKYAHLDSILVSVGQSVAGGQHIAGMGKTGYVTGVHLHFEVLVNGVHQNPLNYLY